VLTREQIETANREFMEKGINAHDVDYIESKLTDDFIEHNPYPGLGNDKKGALETWRAIFAATPDLRYEVLDLIVSGDKVAIRGRITGTDNGTGQLPGVPATGKSFTVESIDVVTVTEDALTSEHYGLFDVPGLMMQLGMMPPPTTPMA
jgi:predicted ester cyclase